MIKTIAQLLKNTFFWLSSNLAGRITSAILFILLTNTADLAEVGAYTLGLTFLALLTPFTLWGLEQLIIRDIPQHPERASTYLMNFILLRLMIVGAGYLFLVGLVFLATYSLFTKTIILLMGIGLITENLSGLFQAFFVAFERLSAVFWIGLSTNLLRLLLGVFVIYQGDGALGIALIFILATSLKAGLLFLILRRTFIKFSGKIQIDRSFWREQLQIAYPFVLFDIFFAIEYQIGQVLLSFYYDEAAVALYGAAFFIISMIMLIPQAYMMTVFPLMARLYKVSRAQLGKVYDKSYQYLLLISLPFALFISITSGWLLGIIYPPDFQMAGPALSILGWSTVFIFLNIPSSRLMIITNHQKQQAWFMAISAVVNIVCNIIFIPLWQINGVAIAKFISGLIFFVPNYLFVYQNIHRLNLIKVSIPAILATLSMALTFFMLLAWHSGLALGISLIVFGITAFIFGGVEKQDINILRSSLSGMLQKG